MWRATEPQCLARTVAVGPVGARGTTPPCCDAPVSRARAGRLLPRLGPLAGHGGVGLDVRGAANARRRHDERTVVTEQRRAPADQVARLARRQVGLAPPAPTATTWTRRPRRPPKARAGSIPAQALATAPDSHVGWSTRRVPEPRSSLPPRLRARRGRSPRRTARAARRSRCRDVHGVRVGSRGAGRAESRSTPPAEVRYFWASPEKWNDTAGLAALCGQRCVTTLPRVKNFTPSGP